MNVWRVSKSGEAGFYECWIFVENLTQYQVVMVHFGKALAKPWLDCLQLHLKVVSFDRNKNNHLKTNPRTLTVARVQVKPMYPEKDISRKHYFFAHHFH